MSSNLGDINVNIKTDSAALDKGLSNAARSVKGFADQARSHIVITVGEIARAVTTIVTALPEAIGRTAKAIGQLYDDTQKLGVLVSKFQALDFAASKAGLSTEGLKQSLFLLQKNIGGGSDDVVAGLKRIGLSIGELKNLSADEQYLKVAEGLGKITNRTEQTNLGFTLLGRSAKENFGLINSNIKETLAEFDKLGLGLTQEQAAAADTFDETKEALGKVFDGFIVKATAEASPALTTLTNQILDFVVQSGGIDVVAKKFANGVVNSLNFAVTSAEKLYTTIVGISDALDRFQGKASNLPGRTLGNGSQEGFAGGFNDVNGNSIFQHPIDTISDGISQGVTAFVDLGKGIFDSVSNANNKIAAFIDSKGLSLHDLSNRPISSIPSIPTGDDFPQLDNAKSAIPSIVDFRQSLIDAAASVGIASASLKNFAKKADDAFSNGLQQGNDDQIKRILGNVDRKPVAVDENFDSIAASIINQIQGGANPNNEQIKTQLGQLNQLANAQNFGAGLEDHTAQKNAINELYKYINNQTGVKVDVQLTIKPTPYAMIEWSNSPTGQKAISSVAGQALSDAAAASANN